MDLFYPTLPIIKYEHNITYVLEEHIPNTENYYIKHAFSKNSEKVILLQIKEKDKLTNFDFFFIKQFLEFNSDKFLRMKSMFIRNESDLFFCYEDGGIKLLDYILKNDVSIVTKVFLFKQACEIVYEYKKLGEMFRLFDYNVFYVKIDPISKLPKLKAIYHAGCLDVIKHINKLFISNNEFSWLYYLYSFIFNDREPYCVKNNLPKIESDINNLLKYAIINGNADYLCFSLENFLNFFSSILNAWNFNDLIGSIKTENDENSMNIINGIPIIKLIENSDKNFKLLSSNQFIKQINNTGNMCNKINVLLNVQNNTSIIDNSQKNYNIINNIIHKSDSDKSIKANISSVKIEEEKIKKNESKFNFKISKSFKNNSTELNKNIDKEEIIKNDIPIISLIKKKKKREDDNKKSKETVVKSKNTDIFTKIHLNSINTMNDKDIALIKSIDNPKKKKSRLEMIEKEKIKKDVKLYETEFENDIKSALNDKKHVFMKDNFPIMYNIENFFLFIKNVNDKRKNKKEEIIAEINHVTNDLLQIKKKWDPNRLSCEEVDNYLYTIEKYWPIENYIWSQETILEILVSKEYNIWSAVEMIKNKSIEFINIIENKQLHRDYHTHSVDSVGIKQRRYRLRNNNN